MKARTLVEISLVTALFFSGFFAYAQPLTHVAATTSDPACVSNGFLAAEVVPPSQGSYVGVFTFARGSCPISDSLNNPNLILYPLDNYFSVRVNDSKNIYVEGDCSSSSTCASQENGFNVVNLDNMTPTILSSTSSSIAIGWTTTAEHLQIVQTIGITGTTEASSQISQSVAVTNLDSMPHTISVRYLWDLYVGDYDGTWIQEYSGTSPGAILGNETDFAPPAGSFTSYAMGGCSSNPCTSSSFGANSFVVFGSISSPPGVATPSRFVFGQWGDMATAFFYNSNPNRHVGSTVPNVGGNDSAVLYYFEGNQLSPRGTISFTAAVTNAPAPLIQNGVPEFPLGSFFLIGIAALAVIAVRRRPSLLNRLSS